jgi:TPR repeat protein
MSQRQVWSLKGVAPEAQERAREAAAREGISVGDWLQKRLLHAEARGGAVPGPKIEPARGKEPKGVRQEGTPRPRAERATESSPPSDTQFAARRIDDAVLAMARLLESNERSQSDASRAIGSLATEINVAARDQAAAFQDLTGRIDRIEQAPDAAELQGTLRDIEKDLSQLADRAVQDVAETTGKIGALAGNVERLDGKIATARTEAHRFGLFVQEQLSTFAERVRSTEAGMARLPEVENTVEALRKRVAGFKLIETSIAQLTNFDSKAAEEIHTLASGLETLANQANTAREETTRLTERIRTAESRTAGIPRVEATVESLGKRVAGLSQIEQTVADIAKRNGAALGQINTLAGTLGTLAGEIATAREASTRLDQYVREQARNFAERLRTAEARLASVPQLEAAVGNLNKRVAGLDQIEKTVAALNKGDSKVSGRIDTLANDFQTFTNRISSENERAAERLRAAEQQLANRPKFETTIEALSKRVDGLTKFEESFAQFSQRNEESARKIRALAGDFDVFRGKISSATEKLESRMRSAEERLANPARADATVENLGKRVEILDRIEKSVSEFDGRDAKTRRLIDSLSGNLETLGSEMVLAREESVKLAERMTLVETRIAAPPAQAQITAGGFDGDERPASGDAADVRQDVSRLEQLLNDTTHSNQELLTELGQGLRAVASRLTVLEEQGTPANLESPAADDSDTGAIQELAPPTEAPDDAPSSNAPSYASEADLPPFEGFDSQQEPESESETEATADADAMPAKALHDYLVQARRAALTAADQTKPDGRASKYGTSSWNSGNGRRKDPLPLLVIAATCLLLVSAIAGYFLIPRGPAQPAQTVEIAAPAPSVTVPDTGTEFDQFTARANLGDAQAMLALSMSYAGGIGVEPNDAQAAMWLERAARAGNAVAQFQLGVAYEKGTGFTVDTKQAVRWYIEAAQAGNTKAMYNLGVSYANGSGVEKNLAQAVRWFQTAATMGLTDAQFNLAVMYEHGLGVPASLVDAYKWHAIAAAGGDSDSKARTEALATQITPAQKSTADQAILAFQPEPLNPAANDAPVLAGGTP